MYVIGFSVVLVFVLTIDSCSVHEMRLSHSTETSVVGPIYRLVGRSVGHN